MKELSGIAHKFGDNISTDGIISGRYKFSITDMKELSKHLMEDLDPEFTKKITPGQSFIVAGRNFGMGSSREQAPWVIKEAGINACIAKSFARIFYRNAFNIGLLLIEADTDKVDDRDELKVNLEKGLLENLSKKTKQNFKPLPSAMRTLLEDGGAIEHFKKQGRLSFEA